MSNKITLLIDMDGVLANWYGKLLERWKKYYPERPAVPTGELKTFYVEDAYPEEDHKSLLHLTRSGNFYGVLDPIEGAIESLKDMENNCLDFIDPYICSAPDLDFEDLECHSQKARWTKRYLGDFWLKRMILTKDKTLVRGHILIDDKPEVTGAMVPTWIHLLFSSSYSGRSEADTFSWKNWPVLRDSIKEDREERNSQILHQEQKIILLG